MTTSGRAAAIAFVVLAAACGESSGLPLLGGAPSSTAGTTPAATVASSTTAGGTTVTTDGSTATTTGSTTTQTTTPPDPFSVDSLLALEPGAPPELTGTAAIIGAAPDHGLAAALTAELEATGLDLTGTRIEVRPATGTGESLLVFWIDDTAIALGDDDGATDTLLGALLGSAIVDGASITRFVINYRSEDDDGPFVLTATALIADMRTALETGRDLTEEQMRMQFTRLEAP